MARIAQQRDPARRVNPVVQLVEVRQLPLQIRAREATQLSHGFAPVGEARNQLGVVALGAPLAFVDGRAAVGRVRDVDDDVVELAVAEGVADGVALGAHPVHGPGLGDVVRHVGVGEERGRGHEDPIGNVARVLGRDGRAVYRVADGGFDAIGADDEVGGEGGVVGEGDGWGREVVGGDARGHEEGDVWVGICGGDEGGD